MVNGHPKMAPNLAALERLFREMAISEESLTNG
jgi:hypothetical protein